jgi:hypothetical protein
MLKTVERGKNPEDGTGEGLASLARLTRISETVRFAWPLAELGWDEKGHPT